MSPKTKLHALILAAGYGTRLGEVGEKTPKGLLEFNNTNLITRIYLELKSLGIPNIAVVTNAKYFPQYSAWASNLPEPVTLVNDHTTSPDNKLGALGDLRFALGELGWQKANLLVAPSDTYFDFSLQLFLQTLLKFPHDFATIVREMPLSDIQNRLGCAVLNRDQTIAQFVEKPADPPSPYAAIPFYYYPAQIHALLGRYISHGNSPDAPGSIIPWLIKNHYPVHACVVTANTIDVGTTKELHLLRALPSTN